MGALPLRCAQAHALQQYKSMHAKQLLLFIFKGGCLWRMHLLWSFIDRAFSLLKITVLTMPYYLVGAQVVGRIARFFNFARSAQLLRLVCCALRFALGTSCALKNYRLICFFYYCSANFKICKSVYYFIASQVAACLGSACIHLPKQNK